MKAFLLTISELVLFAIINVSSYFHVATTLCLTSELSNKCYCYHQISHLSDNVDTLVGQVSCQSNEILDK